MGDIQNSFSGYGTVLEISIMEKLSNRGQKQGFIRFENQDQAKAVLIQSAQSRVLVLGHPTVCKWGKRDFVRNQPPGGGLVVHHPGTGGDDVTTIWIGNLREGVTREDLQTIFINFGEIVVINMHQKADDGSISGFVRYNNKVSCEAALAAVASGSILLHGIPVKAGWAKGQTKAPNEGLVGQGHGPPYPSVPPPQGPPCPSVPPPQTQQGMPVMAPQANESPKSTLFVSGLPSDSNDDDLKNAFSFVGQPCEVRKAGTAGGFAFVKFASPMIADAVLKVVVQSPILLRGNVVNCKMAQHDLEVTVGG